MQRRAIVPAHGDLARGVVGPGALVGEQRVSGGDHEAVGQSRGDPDLAAVARGEPVALPAAKGRGIAPQV